MAQVGAIVLYHVRNLKLDYTADKGPLDMLENVLEVYEQKAATLGAIDGDKKALESEKADLMSQVEDLTRKVAQADTSANLFQGNQPIILQLATAAAKAHLMGVSGLEDMAEWQDLEGNCARYEVDNLNRVVRLSFGPQRHYIQGHESNINYWENQVQDNNRMIYEALTPHPAVRIHIESLLQASKAADGYKANAQTANDARSRILKVINDVDLTEYPEFEAIVEPLRASNVQLGKQVEEAREKYTAMQRSVAYKIVPFDKF